MVRGCNKFYALPGCPLGVDGSQGYNEKKRTDNGNRDVGWSVRGMYEFAGIVGVDPRGFSFGELRSMVDARLKQNWLLFGRLTVDLINSQRVRRDQISPIGLYPFFERPICKATIEDELNLVEQLKGSTWLTITKTT